MNRFKFHRYSLEYGEENLERLRSQVGAVHQGQESIGNQRKGGKKIVPPLPLFCKLVSHRILQYIGQVMHAWNSTWQKGQFKGTPPYKVVFGRDPHEWEQETESMLCIIVWLITPNKFHQTAETSLVKDFFLVECTSSKTSLNHSHCCND
jgi:hypothetical protein